MSLARRVNDIAVALFLFERRIDPAFRPLFNRVLREPIAAVVQALINLRRPNEHLAIAAERLLPNEEAIADAITEQMALFIKAHYGPGTAQRAGNTKTYGVVRGEFTVLPDLPPHLRQGLFAQPRTYPVWVRFAGPGPLAPPDMEDNGVLSIGIKVMGVEGEKLLDDEKMTQDFTGISAPTFTTPNVVENLKLQRLVAAGTPVLYFLNPFDSHLLDAVMQGLWSQTQTSPLEVPYYSCVAYLLGEGQAIHYCVRPRSNRYRPNGRSVPRNPSPNYLREAMARTLARTEVLFDFLVQLQTDPHRMPIEDASVRWPERLSPFVAVATLRLPTQTFDSEAQLAFAGNLSYNSWHSLAAHRPLGNQNRARKRIYLTVSRLRQEMNCQPHVEPTGDEVFD